MILSVQNDQWLRLKGNVNWTEMARFRLVCWNCNQIIIKLLVLYFILELMSVSCCSVDLKSLAGEVPFFCSVLDTRRDAYVFLNLLCFTIQICFINLLFLTLIPLWEVGSTYFLSCCDKIRQLFLRPAACLTSALLETGVGANHGRWTNGLTCFPKHGG
jgi:hypothetical protein